MKHYVFLSIITGAGGMQCYVAAKAKYLEEHGWHVVIISWNNPQSDLRCQIGYLNKYLSNGTPLLHLHPCEIPKCLVNRTLRHIIKKIGRISLEEEIIVESWSSPTALWGELLSSRIHARHIFLTASESFRPGAGPCNQLYEEKIDFYMFKMDRGEVFTTVRAANRLFEGYRIYKEGDFKEVVICEAPVQDVESPEIDALKKEDWNICYIGRSNKPYVPNIFSGIGEFSRKHCEKKILFVIVGEVKKNKELLNNLKEIDNLRIIELGNLFPLPRCLYNKIDVIIAGSGSARHSADEGALVIMADSESNNSHGLLGYDTNESIYRDNNESKTGLDLTFSQALERTLVEKKWQKQSNKWEKSPNVAECAEIQFDIINNAKRELVYYNEIKLLEGKKEYLILLRHIRANVLVRIKSFLKIIIDKAK